MRFAVAATVAGFALLPASPVSAKTWAFVVDDCIYYVKGEDTNRDGMLSLSESESSWLECPEGDDKATYLLGSG